MMNELESTMERIAPPPGATVEQCSEVIDYLFAQVVTLSTALAIYSKAEPLLRALASNDAEANDIIQTIDAFRSMVEKTGAMH